MFYRHLPVVLSIGDGPRRGSKEECNIPGRWLFSACKLFH